MDETVEPNMTRKPVAGLGSGSPAVVVTDSSVPGSSVGTAGGAEAGIAGASTTAGAPSGGSESGSADGSLIRMALAQVRGRRAAPKPLPVDAFPGYEILKQLSTGGQGVVYQALQKSTKRRVAVKVMREGPLTGHKEQVRFEREVEILTSLNHPNIVAIHDSGIANTPGGGLRYFVMDYVSGQSLDSWVNESSRTVGEVLGLFTKICDAVNAAHLRGVIHRDLKPSNIRVDTHGEPHILDFGLAKSALTDGGEGDDAGMTATGQFLGSLPWSSPEQADGKVGSVDVRSDVYSLGVLLYQMLTGRFPYQVVGAMRDVLDNILRAAPTRPSTIDTPDKPRIDDDVETIVLKCLSKERERRYQSAGDLGRDLRNYLAGEPIEAKRDSPWYMLRMTLHRHQVGVAAAAAVLVALLGAGVVATVFWRVAEANATNARGAAAAAIVERDRAERTTEFLQGMLQLIEPDVARGSRTFVVEDMLRDAGAVVDTRLAGDPDVAASMRDSIGLVYYRLGKYDTARGLFAAALDWRVKNLGPNHPLTAQSLLHHAEALVESGQDKDRETARAQAAEAGRAFALVYGANSQTGADCLDTIGLAWKKGRNWEQAETHYRAALAMRTAAGPPNAVGFAETWSNLGELYYDQSKFAEAVAAQEAQLAIRILNQETQQTRVATAKQSLAAALAARGQEGDNNRAEQLFEEAITQLRGLVGNDHPFMLATMNKYGRFVLRQLNEPARAESILSANLSARLRTLDPSHPYVAASRINLAEAYRKLGRFDEAEQLYRTVLRTLPPQNIEYARTQCRLVDLTVEKAEWLAEHERAGETDAVLRGGRDAFVSLIAGKSEILAADATPTLTKLEKALRDRNLLGEAEVVLSANFHNFLRSVGVADARTVDAAERLAAFYRDTGQTDKLAVFDRERGGR